MPVWRYAQAQGAVLVTKDEDFAEWVRRGRPGPQVVWLRIGNCAKRERFGRCCPPSFANSSKGIA
jgi:predicted nuclease of predicted toxin-antitoxin system